MHNISRAALAAIALMATAPVSAGITSYSTRDELRAAHGTGTIEDFEDSNMGSGGGAPMEGVLDASTDNGVFSPGSIVAGLSIEANGGGNLAVIGENYGGTGLVSTTIFSNQGTGLTLTFGEGIRAFGLDLFSLFSAETQTISLFGDSGLLGSFDVASASTGTGSFFGVFSTDLIRSVSLIGAQFEGIDNVEFGDGTAQVPEPAALSLLGLGLVGVALRRRKRA